MSPRSVSIAMPTCTDRGTWIPSPCHDALINGWPAHVSARAVTNTGSGDTSSSRRNASSSVQSTVRNVVTCGIAADLGQPLGDLPANRR